MLFDNEKTIEIPMMPGEPTAKSDFSPSQKEKTIECMQEIIITQIEGINI